MMSRWWKFAVLFWALVLLTPQEVLAPVVWRRGEGWSWERGGIKTAANPREQMEMGLRYEKNKEWDLAIICYQRLLKRWPTSYDMAAKAQYRIGICYENQEFYAQAVDAYQKVLENYPDTPQFRDILERQFKIGNLFLSGERQKVWKVKLLPGLDKAVEAFEKVLRNGPYTDLAPQAQFHIGLARKKQGNWAKAIEAFQAVLDKYPDSDWVDDAMFELGTAYFKQSRSADYDQEAARRAVDWFTEFLANYPDDPRAPQAKQCLDELNLRSAEGLYKIARYYDGRGKEAAALVYYSELVRSHRDTEFAQRAIPRLEELKAKRTPSSVSPPTPSASSEPAPPSGRAPVR